MKMLKWRMAAAMVLAVCGIGRAEVKVEEKVLGPVPGDAGAVAGSMVSEHGVHVAIVEAKGSRYVVMVDGVEGPKFDDVVAVNHMHEGASADNRLMLFSGDGSRAAYVGRDGAENVVMVDGKEMGRSKAGVDYLLFSPGGKHVYYASGGGMFMDGQGVPAILGGVRVTFSKDDGRYLYAAANMALHEPGVCVDGKVMDYAGHDFAFSGDGQHVVGVASDKEGDKLLMDGKVVLEAAGAAMDLTVGPTENHWAVVERPSTGEQRVVIDGKAVEGVDGKENHVYFSGDGKHAAVVCGTMETIGGQTWVIEDGKKGETYETVQTAFYTEDSAKFVYQAMKNYKWFMVVGDEEWDGHSLVKQMTTSATGRMAFMDAANLVVDNKVVSPPPMGGVITMLFSGDGARLAYVQTTRGTITVDGADWKGVTFTRLGGGVKNFGLTFSGDGKHLMCAGSSSGRAGKAVKGVIVDGQVVGAMGEVSHPLFTVDGQHVVWVAGDPAGHDAKHKALFVDGKAVVSFEGSMFDEAAGACEAESDGTVRVVGASEGVMKLYTVTVGGETGVASMIADAAAATPTEPTTPTKKPPKVKKK